MRADALAELRAIMRGERAQSSGTDGTPGTLTIVRAQKCPSFHAFHVFRSQQGILRNEHFEPGTRAGTWPLPHDITEAERAAIALELGRVPPTYADAWAAFQTRKPGHVPRPTGNSPWIAPVASSTNGARSHPGSAGRRPTFSVRAGSRGSVQASGYGRSGRTTPLPRPGGFLRGGRQGMDDAAPLPARPP